MKKLIAFLTIFLYCTPTFAGYKVFGDLEVSGDYALGSTLTQSSGNAYYKGVEINSTGGLDWTIDQGSTNIHPGNYTNTTYTAGTGMSLTGTEFACTVTDTDNQTLQEVCNEGAVTTTDLQAHDLTATGYIWGDGSKLSNIGSVSESDPIYNAWDKDYNDLTSKPTIPSGNQIIDWTTDQGTTNIHSGNYIDTDTTYTAGTGMTLDGTTFNCTVTDTNTIYTAGAGLGLTGTEFSFDGGSTPSGELGNTWASPTIADNIIDEANMKISNAPTNDYILTADNSVTGGWRWAALSSGFSDPMTTRGDIIYKDSSNVTTRLPIGSNGQVLISNGTDLNWGAITGSGDVVGPSSAVDDNIATFNSTTGKLIQDGSKTISQVLARTNHTGTQTVSTISDFDAEVSNNSAVSANTAKVTNATHTGEVTGATALTIADNIIDEANMKISNAPIDDYMLIADSSATGGWKWASGSSANSPLTAKGDVYVYGAADARLPVGADDYVLTADSSESLGVKWAAASGGSSPWTDGGTYIYPASAEAIITKGNTYGSTYVGWETGGSQGATDNNNTAFGYQALSGLANSSADNNVAIGREALEGYTGQTVTGDWNVAVGYQAGEDILSSQGNVFLGYQAGSGERDGNYNVYIGHNSYQNAHGGTNCVNIGAITNVSETFNDNNSNNVFIGTNTGLNLGASGGVDDSIAIGHEAGLGNIDDNELWIANSADATPLIFGDFATDELTINGAFETTGEITANQAINIIKQDAGVGLVMTKYSVESGAAGFNFQKAGGTLASPTTIPDGDTVAAFNAKGYYGAGFETGAYFKAEVDGTVSTGCVPMRWTFATEDTGDTVASERFAIEADGTVAVANDLKVNGDIKGSNGYIAASDIKSFSFSITKPKDLAESSTLPVWVNRTGKTFNIVAIYSNSDTNAVAFTLDEGTNPHDFSSVTEIDSINISTAGTGVYYNDTTSGITHTTIEDTHLIFFDNDGTDDPDYVNVTIKGYLS